MSIDVDWSKLAGGEDRVRQFIHDKFQQVTLPRFIRSVKVHSFDFGSATPDIEIKDICDPLPDFYDEDEDEDDDDHDENDQEKTLRDRRHRPREPAPDQKNQRPLPHADPRLSASRTGLALGEPLGNLSRAPTPAIPGGTSNMSYFHLPLGAGLSGTTTPFAAVAGAQFQNGWHDHHSHSHHADPPQTPRNHSASISSNTPPSSTDLDSRPQSQHQHDAAMQTLSEDYPESDTSSPPTPPIREASPEDIQIVAHVRYSGDVKMVLTAEINLDYPMPSFVGIPLKLTVTGLTFDGVAILAYIKKRAHFCFLSPEDADALIGSEGGDGKLADDQTAVNGNLRAAAGGLLEEIKVESEIGQKEHGKQVLKNVGKVEKFILEQVRRIFEDEFVYPSFWTFLV
ncbi:uncharacterized protein BKA78DRAFT_332930 [Phyllosticta capitalensis]|uniref:uncharacterized protein n=1 Tax=Phyllosticta capitalensis TaxID=121624 RepID=UPI00313203BD